MFKRMDRSVWLSRFIDRLSDMVAKQRGLPIMVGVVLVFLSLIIQSVNVFANSPALELLGVIVIHAGVLTALIGLLMVTPLGR
jgi:hypothetical protein